MLFTFKVLSRPERENPKKLLFFSIFSLCVCVCALKVDSMRRTSIKTMYGFFWEGGEQRDRAAEEFPSIPEKWMHIQHKTRERETAGAELFQLWNKFRKLLIFQIGMTKTLTSLTTNLHAWRRLGDIFISFIWFIFSRIRKKNSTERSRWFVSFTLALLRGR